MAVQGRLISNHAHRINEVEIVPTNGGGTQIFSGHRNESKFETTPTMKKEIAVMAFCPSSFDHSLGVATIILLTAWSRITWHNYNTTRDI